VYVWHFTFYVNLTIIFFFFCDEALYYLRFQNYYKLGLKYELLQQIFSISHLQTCNLTFGSWTYNTQEVKLKWYISSPDFKHADLSNYEPSGQWDLVDVPAKIETKNYTYGRHKPMRSSCNYPVISTIVALKCLKCSKKAVGVDSLHSIEKQCNKSPPDGFSKTFQAL